MSRYKKGESGNPKGRPAGSKNKSSENIKNIILDFIENNITNIQNDFAELKPRDKLKFLTDLLPYVIPKVKDLEKEESDPLAWYDYSKNDLDDLFTLDGFTHEQPKSKTD